MIVCLSLSCLSVCLSICLSVCLYVDVCMHVCLYVSMPVRLYVCMCVWLCMEYFNKGTSECMSAYVCVCVRMSAYVCMYVYGMHAHFQRRNIHGRIQLECTDGMIQAKRSRPRGRRTKTTGSSMPAGARKHSLRAYVCAEGRRPALQ